MLLVNRTGVWEFDDVGEASRWVYQHLGQPATLLQFKPLDHFQNPYLVDDGYWTGTNIKFEYEAVAY